MAVIGLDPTSGPLAAANERRAQRKDSLSGAVIGLVSNGLGESDSILAALAEEIGRHVPIARIVAVRKPSVSVPPDPFDWERLINEVTAAVTGFGG